MYSEFGSEVTVIDMGDRLMPREDEEIAERVKAILEAKGIKFLIINFSLCLIFLLERKK